jgi:L-2,4-diaminobutyrate decarboxylase
MSFHEDARTAVDLLAAYLDESRRGDGPVIRQPPMRALADELGIEAHLREGGLAGERLGEFLARYLRATTRLHHPGYMAHQVAVPHPSGSIGSLVDGLTNNAMAVYEMGPAAATIELVLLNWMLAKVGFRPAPVPPAQAVGTGGPGGPPSQPTGGGVLVHGGSLANLTALLAARSRVDPGAWRDGARRDLVLLVPASAHYSNARAAGILGLGHAGLRELPVDRDGRTIPAGVEAALDTAAREGRTVLAVVANACCTATGVYDPLREIAGICRARGAWLHVDGAHGASALVSPRLRARLDGVELADSLVWDAHKMLRAPTVCAAVLVRDGRDLDHAFQQEASYLFHEKDEPGFDFLHRTVECTKAALGLRLFLALAAEGESGAARYVERQTALALEAAAVLREEGLEVATEPESNIVCFRAAGDDALQLEVRRRLLAAERFYISTTEHAGRRWLRLALMNPLTEARHIRELAREVRALAG